MSILLLIFLGLLGAIFGSFTACQVRRAQYSAKKSPHVPTNSNATKPASAKKSPRKSPNSAKPTPAKPPDLGPRSLCLHCHTRLRWYDNIPIFSWLALRGRCRTCGAKIGTLEILSELGLALVFVLLGASALGLFGSAGLASVFPGLSAFLTGLNPSSPLASGTASIITNLDLGVLFTTPAGLLQLLAFILLLATATGLWYLLLYDATAGLLPTRVLTFCIICAIIERLALFSLNFLPGVDPLSTPILADPASSLAPLSAPTLGPAPAISPFAQPLLSLLGALLILPGPYFALYKISHERWVGAGDWLLCLALAFLLDDWWLALLALFLANFLGSLFALPALLKSPRQKNSTKSAPAKSPQLAPPAPANPPTPRSTSSRQTPRAKPHQIPFGPFLITATLLVLAFSGVCLSLLP